MRNHSKRTKRHAKIVFRSRTYNKPYQNHAGIKCYTANPTGWNQSWLTKTSQIPRRNTIWYSKLLWKESAEDVVAKPTWAIMMYRKISGSTGSNTTQSNGTQTYPKHRHELEQADPESDTGNLWELFPASSSRNSWIGIMAGKTSQYFQTAREPSKNKTRTRSCKSV